MRPHIICHMMSSIDGRLSGDRWSLPFDGTDIESVFQPYYEVSLQLKAQAWMLGRNTVQIHHAHKAFDHQQNNPATNFNTFIGKRETQRLLIVLDPQGKIFYDSERIEGDNVITILGECVSDRYLSHLKEMNISYLFAGTDGKDINKAMSILAKEFGITKILLEGGGIVNGNFLHAGLIDEISLLVYPGIDGLSGVSSIFEYLGQPNEQPASKQRLELINCKQLAHGVCWLYYKVHKH